MQSQQLAIQMTCPSVTHSQVAHSWTRTAFYAVPSHTSPRLRLLDLCVPPNTAAKLTSCTSSDSVPPDATATHKLHKPQQGMDPVSCSLHGVFAGHVAHDRKKHLHDLGGLPWLCSPQEPPPLLLTHHDLFLLEAHTLEEGGWLARHGAAPKKGVGWDRITLRHT